MKFIFVRIFQLGFIAIVLSSISNATPMPPECSGTVECTSENSKIKYLRPKMDNKEFCKLTSEDSTRCQKICENKNLKVKICKVNPKPIFHNNNGEGTL